jgi:membrane protein implicated in regulation of membrane protease activity
MPAVPWWAWALVAVLLGLGELHAPGSYLIWIALGAAVAAGADAAFALTLEHQLITFIVASGLSCVAGYFVYRRRDVLGSKGTPLNQRGASMVGARGTVCEPILNGQGKVRLGDTVWAAEGPDLPEGTPIVVRSVKGVRMIVGASDSAA